MEYLFLILTTVFSLHTLVFFEKNDNILEHNLLLSIITAYILSFYASFLLILYLGVFVFTIKFVSSCGFHIYTKVVGNETAIIPKVVISNLIDNILIISTILLLL